MIPTIFGAIGASFFQNYWWLRSPTTNPIYVYGAWHVYPDGHVGLTGYSVPGDNGYYNVSYSYGRLTR